jgi:hypothetical protein
LVFGVVAASALAACGGSKPSLSSSTSTSLAGSTIPPGVKSTAAPITSPLATAPGAAGGGGATGGGGAAGGAGGSGPAGAKAPDACGQLSTSDIQAALGGTVGAGSVNNSADGRQSVCDWNVTEASGNIVGLELSIGEGGTKQDFEQLRQGAAGKTADVNGVGKEAFSELVNTGGHVFDDVYVLFSTGYFRLQYLKDVGPDPLVKLAKIVAPKIP